MKYKRICRTLALSIILALLVPASAVPAYAAGEFIGLYPDEGEIGDWIEVDARNFSPNQVLYIYLSSYKAEEDEQIGVEVTAYEQILTVTTDNNGDFTHTYHFQVPDALTDGEVIEDVHGGNYYVYITYLHSDFIIKTDVFIVLDGEIELDLEEGTVGTEVTISGEGLRPEQQITVTYDEDEVAIVSGDSQTDEEGQFTCTIIIPESAFGSHTIIVNDVSGNKPEAEFTVKSKITIDPTTQTAGKEVNVSGTGFGNRKVITITFDGYEIPTTPEILSANNLGSFNGSCLVPFRDSYGTSTIEAIDSSCNSAEAQLTVLAGISISPITSSTSPGHVGTELTLRGTAFTANTTVTVTYSNNGETIPIDTTSTDDYGSFLLYFTIPPSFAGSHDIIVTDGTSTVTTTFIMESRLPPRPTPLLPKAVSTAEPETHFDWEEVDDISQPITYSLQVASDNDFSTIVLERKELTTSEYTLTEEEMLASTERKAPYYWRVKAIDGAFNESAWTYPISFYVGVSWTALPGWAWYILYALGAVLLGILGFWLRKRRAKK